MKGCVDDDVFKIIPCLTHIDRAEMTRARVVWVNAKEDRDIAVWITLATEPTDVDVVLGELVEPPITTLDGERAQNAELCYARTNRT